MKHLKLILLASIILYAGCQKDTADDITPDEEPVYLQDNIFGCDQFEVMETSAQFSVNVEPFLEVFHSFFVYEDNDGLVIRDGFNGPTLQNYDLQVDDMAIFNDQLMICAFEGLFRWNASGTMDTITLNRCYSMAVDGQNRLMMLGDFEQPSEFQVYDIFEFKNNTIAPFATFPDDLIGCGIADLIAGESQELYVYGCDNQMVAYKNGVVKSTTFIEEAPFFAYIDDQILYEYYDGGLFAIMQDLGDAFRVYKLVGQQWLPFYDLESDEFGTDKVNEALLYLDHNLLIHEGFLYAFGTGGNDVQRPAIARYDVSGDAEKGWEDIELIQIPGLNSRSIVDVVVASDGSAYAVMRTNNIVKLTCD